MTSIRVLDAISFATVKYHFGVSPLRKYSGEPYIVHPLAVARILTEKQYNENVVIAAICHDLYEDTGVLPHELATLFGNEVADLVGMVTNPSKKEDGKRETRKAIDRAHIAKASDWAKAIKLADIKDNLRTVNKDTDPGFCKVYRNEKRLLLPILRDCSDHELWLEVKQELDKEDA